MARESLRHAVLKQSRIITDFDEIAGALAASRATDRLSSAERAILRAIPTHARTGLDVGCGHGVVTRAAARRGLAMTGVDLSPKMVALARERTERALGVTYVVGDIMTASFERHAFDVVVSVNMVHHLPVSEIVARLAQLVEPGGRLLVQDVLSRPGLRYLPHNFAAVASRVAQRLMGLDGHSRSVRRLYARHGEGESYLTPDAVARVYSDLLPGAEVVQHLEWRYSVIWTRPTAG